LIPAKYFFRLGWIALLIWPSLALAHSPSKGLIGFYAGIWHVYSEVSLAMALVALGLLAGQTTDLDKLRKLLALFLVTVVLSSVIASFAPIVVSPWDLQLALWGCVVLVCFHAALQPNWTSKVIWIWVAWLGLIMGQLTVPDPGEFLPFVVTLTGSITGCVLGFLYTAALVAFLYRRFQLLWQRILLRIISAWLFAISFLLLAVQYTNKNI
jgi:hypothetical protein